MTAVAAWLSQGSLTYTGHGAERIALLPVSMLALGACLVAAAIVFWSVERGGGVRPLALLGLVLLPWIPGNLPPVLLLWSGPLAVLVWIAFGAAVLLPFPGHATVLIRPARRTAAAVAFVIGLVSWGQASLQVPSGDEPHYLVIAQSLLKDYDLKIENNHRRRDYRSYFDGELPPDFRVPGRDRQIYSIHAPGVSALVAPVFAVGGYRAVVLLLLVVSALGSALAWHLARIVTGRGDAAWFGWAAVTFSSTWIFHSFTIYPDGPGVVLLLTGVWALLRVDEEAAEARASITPWFWHGTALALLPWMHSRFAVLAGTIGALVLLRMARVPNAAAKAFAFLAVPAVSFIGWMAYFIAIYAHRTHSRRMAGRRAPSGSCQTVSPGCSSISASASSRTRRSCSLR